MNDEQNNIPQGFREVHPGLYERVEKPLASQCCDRPSDEVCEHFFSCRLDATKRCLVHDRQQVNRTAAEQGAMSDE